MNYGADRKTQLTSRFHFLFLLKKRLKRILYPPNYPKTADLDGYPWPGLCRLAFDLGRRKSPRRSPRRSPVAELEFRGDFLGDLRAYDGLRQSALCDK
jgi:hypothetical protein